MAESVSWMEGTISLYTGNASPSNSAVVAQCQNVSLRLNRGWMNREALDGTYRDHYTGQRADITIGQFYNYDGTLVKMEASATAVHIKAMHSNTYGSAGYFFYSGRIDAVQVQGSNGGLFTFTITYHSNSWSAF